MNHQEPVRGPGDELANLISWFVVAKKCGSCRSHRDKMNEWGVNGCNQNLDQIVAWLEESARRHSLATRLVPRPAIRRAVKYAINSYKRRAEKKPLHPTPPTVTKLGSLASVPDNLPAEPETPAFKTADWPFVWTYFAAGAVGDELRFSIRSVTKHVPDARIVVVGDQPPWYTGELIPKARIGKTDFRPFRDCYSKLLLAAEHFERFVWMMDDVYWMHPFTIEEAATPKYIRHVTPEDYQAMNRRRNAWTKTKVAAFDWLMANSRPTYDFASHLPQPFWSKELLQMERDHNLMTGRFRNFENLYFNQYFAQHGKNWDGQYIRVIAKIGAVPGCHRILNHTNQRWHGVVEQTLRDKYPDPSPYEQA